jgi:MYXO-CTERM domain-containing protein
MRKFMFAAFAGLALTSAASAEIWYQTTITELDSNGQQIGSSFEWTWSPSATQDPFQAHGGSWGDVSGENPNAATFGNGAKLHGVGIQARQNPIVGLNFNVAANPLSNSTFQVDSIIVSGITGADWEGQASAAVSVTNSGTLGNTTSITLLGLQSGGNLFSARFNGTNVFTDILTGPGTVAQGSGVTQTFSASSGAYAAFSGNPTIADIRSQFRFTLSAGDRAAGTSTYELRQIPAPGALSLLAVGGLVAARRRRA